MQDIENCHYSCNARQYLTDHFNSRKGKDSPSAWHDDDDDDALQQCRRNMFFDLVC